MKAIVSEEQTQETESLVEGTIEDMVIEFVRLKAERSALEGRIEYLKERIQEHYDENTQYEAETIEIAQYNVQTVDRSRTSMLNKKELSKKYGQEWVKNHQVVRWHRQLNVKPKKRSM